VRWYWRSFIINKRRRDIYHWQFDNGMSSIFCLQSKQTSSSASQWIPYFRYAAASLINKETGKMKLSQAQLGHANVQLDPFTCPYG
jgi:hypothetical protein